MTSQESGCNKTGNNKMRDNMKAEEFATKALNELSVVQWHMGNYPHEHLTKILIPLFQKAIDALPMDEAHQEGRDCDYANELLNWAEGSLPTKGFAEGDWDAFFAYTQRLFQKALDAPIKEPEGE